jgi:uncharacterized protein YerC
MNEEIESTSYLIQTWNDIEECWEFLDDLFFAGEKDLPEEQKIQKCILAVNSYVKEVEFTKYRICRFTSKVLLEGEIK